MNTVLTYYWPKFHLARLDTTRHIRLCRASRASRDERVERDKCVEPCFSNTADDKEAVVLACTSLVFCAINSMAWFTSIIEYQFLLSCKMQFVLVNRKFIYLFALSNKDCQTIISETVMSTCEAVVSSLKKDYINVKKASVHCFYCTYCCLNVKINNSKQTKRYDARYHILYHKLN